MIILFISSLTLWLLLTNVCRKKSFQPLNIGKGESFRDLVIALVVSSVIGFVFAFIMPFEEFNTENFYLWLVGTFLIYMVHVIMNKKYRNSIKEYFRFDRWNAIALVACIQYGIIVTATT